MKALTVFTPTYNRKHTIIRTFESLCRQTSSDFDWLIIDDGSIDGTRKWVESLGVKTSREGVAFDWMGRNITITDENHFVIQTPAAVQCHSLRIEYIYKPNGGLYTGYNTAYATIQTELCVCIDSDDYMPDDAVEKIVTKWKNYQTCINKVEIAGLVGLDFNVVNMKPIGGYFPEDNKVCYWEDLHHSGDSKQVMRTNLMRRVAPQVGFQGERDFNPYYMLMQVCNAYKVLVVNENFCWVEYQTTGDSMSAGIWKQYVRSPRSYAKYRIMQMQMKHGIDLKRKLMLCIHYVSSCILSHDSNWLHNSPKKLMTLCVSPLGLIFTWFVKYKNRR
jgi:glycosyltransferase involved in cell wall biosynthesis